MKRMGSTTWCKSAFKGVTWDRQFNKWRARITLPDSSRLHLGRFTNELDAARAVDHAFEQHYNQQKDTQ